MMFGMQVMVWLEVSSTQWDHLHHLCYRHQHQHSCLTLSRLFHTSLRFHKCFICTIKVRIDLPVVYITCLLARQHEQEGLPLLDVVNILLLSYLAVQLHVRKLTNT